MNDVSLQRLLALSRRTGDRLIIFDSTTNQSLVLMDLDQYEHLLSSTGHDVRNYSGKEMVDHINRELAIWKSEHEESEREELAEYLQEELLENPLHDPFAEDFVHTSEWHSVGDVLIGEEENDDELFMEEEEDEDIEEIVYEEPIVEPMYSDFHQSPVFHRELVEQFKPESQTSSLDWENTQPVHEQSALGLSSSFSIKATSLSSFERRMQELSNARKRMQEGLSSVKQEQPSLLQPTKPIPHTPQFEVNQFQEKRDDEGPVFFEEPV